MNTSTAASPGRYLLSMSSRYLIILFMFCLTSCFWNAYPEEKYSFDNDFRALIKCYDVGDTLVFKSSTNLVDTFIISNIDSAINNKKGFFINPRNSKSITISYKQYPVDKWQRSWIEMGPNNSNKKEITEDGTFITIEKFPDNGTSEYYFNFKEFGCSDSKIPKLRNDTVTLNDITFTNYYKIENCDINSDIPYSIRICYSTVDKGLLAFVTKNGDIWTRINQNSR